MKSLPDIFKEYINGIANTYVDGSIFAILIGVVIFRHGIRGVVKAYSDGTPRSLR